MDFSGCGWNEENKRFDAKKEVWDEFCRAHPSCAWVRTDSVADYEDLLLIVGNKMATGGAATWIGGTRPTPITPIGTDHTNDDNIDSFQEDMDQESIPDDTSSRDPRSPASVDMETNHKTKRSRTTSGGGVADEISELQAGVNEISQSVRVISTIMAKKNQENSWHDILEIPDLDDDTRFAAS